MTHSSSRTETPRIVETEFHVRYAETDAMGVVHHATYLVYFEEGRSHYMRAMNSDYAEIEAQGFQLPVTEVAVRFAGSLCYGQRVRIRTWIEENRSRQLTFAYEVVDADPCLPGNRLHPPCLDRSAGPRHPPTGRMAG